MIFFHPLPQASWCVATQFDVGIARRNIPCADAVSITVHLLYNVLFYKYNIETHSSGH